MSTASVSPAGALRISSTALSALIAMCQGFPEDAFYGDDIAALREAAAVGGGQVAEPARAALGGLLSASVRVELVAARPGGRQMHRAWLTPESATLVLQVGADEYDVLAVAPALVVPTFARLMDLGPRPVPPGLLMDVSDEILEGMVGEAVSDTAKALLGVAPPGWDAVAEDARLGRATIYGLMSLWIGSDGQPAARRASFLDTPSAIAEVVARDEGRTSLRPIRSTEAWSMLAQLLPSDQEIAPDSDVAPRIDISET